MVLDRLHFVVEVIGLPTALQFAHDRFDNNAVRQRIYKCLDGKPPLGCGRDHGKIAQAFQRHGERARDRGRRQRQHIHFRAQRFQRFFLAHTEAMLFIKNHQAKILERHILLYQFVGADGNIDGAVGDPLQRE